MKRKYELSIGSSLILTHEISPKKSKIFKMLVSRQIFYFWMLSHFRETYSKIELSEDFCNLFVDVPAKFEACNAGRMGKFFLA